MSTTLWLVTKGRGCRNLGLSSPSHPKAGAFSLAAGWRLRFAELLLGLAALHSQILGATSDRTFQAAAQNGKQAEEVYRRTHKMMMAWLAHADKRTLLLPDYLPGFRWAKGNLNLYTPHNSAADNYPYLVSTTFLTDRVLFGGRMREMLRNEIRYTNAAHGVPGSLQLDTGKLGEMSLFGAAEYAKDGLVPITELLGRTPWYYRMVDMTAAVMEQSTVASDFGNLPSNDAELNGDLLQVLVRLAAMSGDPRFLHWAERLGDAYVREVLPRNHGLPASTWDFVKHEGPDNLRLDDHGNEIIVGLVLLYALEDSLKLPRAETYRPAITRMLDRVLESANPDGMIYNAIRCSDLQPTDKELTDNWGYIYAAVYTLYMVTGETRYRDAVLRVLRNLSKYHGHDFEHGTQDGYADSAEGALYLLSREPVPEAADYVEDTIKTMFRYQQPDGTVERWYGDGNWARTLLLYAFYKTQGCWVEAWREGVRLGAIRDGDRLYVSIESNQPWRGKLHFDYARHRRTMNFDRNYARLNEWPEWFTVNENALYQVRGTSGREHILLGSDLKDGVAVASPAKWIVEPYAGK